MFQFVSVTGSDAGEFLQGQLTQDVALVSDRGILPAAWCSPKGRVYATMYIAATPTGLLLIMAKNVCADVMQRLTMYRFRAQVELAEAGDAWRAMAVAGESNLQRLEQHSLLPDRGSSVTSDNVHAVRPLATDDYVELYAPHDVLAKVGLAIDAALRAEDWQARRIRAGLATIDATNREKFTPHMLNLDRVGAISFTKGCYTGQEIVARTENLGRSRRRLGYFRAARAGIQVGQKISDAERDIGDVVNVAGVDVLAVFPHEETFQHLRAGDIALQQFDLPYVR